MQDSLQLPEDLDEVNMQTLMSPQQQPKPSVQNTPRHSLAYSNSTYAKDKHGDLHFRSPLAFQNIQTQSPSQQKANNENLVFNGQKINSVTLANNIVQSNIISHQKDSDKVVKKAQYKKVNPKIKGIIKSPGKVQKFTELHQPSIKEQNIQQVSQIAQRKTIDKTETFKLKQRLNQLQQALHIETVISEQLRTKLTVVTSLLQQKLKENGFQFFFDLKNKSRDLKNIDIFIEMNQLHKNMTEKNIILERQKNQMQQMKVQIDRLRSKKTNTPPSKTINPNSKLMTQIEQLKQEKLDLFVYIDEQKGTMMRKIAYIAELEQEINRMGDTETHYTSVERPKFLQQLAQLKGKVNRLEQELQKTKMEHTLTQIKANQEKIRLQHEVSQLQRQLKLKQQQILQTKNFQNKIQSKTYKSQFIQKDDIDHQILQKQLTILKTERDHYLSQFRKRTAQSAELYSMKLKFKTLIQREDIASTVQS